MNPVNSYRDLMRLEEKKQIVAVFVASGLDTEAIKWVFDTWSEINRRSGDRWHVVVPLINMPFHERDFSVLTNQNYNTELAQEIRDVYGIADEDTPALVFDDFNDEARQMTVSLFDKEERKAIILEIERFMNVETPNGKPLTDAERQATNAKLIAHLQMQRLKRSAFGWAKKQGSALGKIVLQGAFKGALKAHGM
jgi:hypothetical protein